jgi:hypothetical protein
MDESVEVVRFQEIVEGTYRTPKRFGRPSRSMDAEGFSDHFPIGVVVEENDG